jgi:hypothetical protein
MRQLFLSLFVAAFAFTSVAAHKNKSLNCTASLDNLIAVTNSVTSLTSKEQAGLIKIASDAKNLLLIGKANDALNKLYNYQTKLDQLAATLSDPKPKITATDEQTLRTALNEAIACVSGA